MSKSSLLRIVLIAATVALTAFLYFAPKTNSVPKVSKGGVIDFDYVLEAAKSKLQH
jgi:hypothetical protein